MQNAPSVAYPVGRFVWERLFVHWFAVLGLLVCVGWGLEHLRHAAGPVSFHGAQWALISALAVVWLIWWRWLKRAEAAAPGGELLWGGESAQGQWSWSGLGDVCVVRPRIVLDLGDRLWLRLECADGPVVWLWAVHSTDPSQWLPLRRALQSCADRQLTPRV